MAQRNLNFKNPQLQEIKALFSEVDVVIGNLEAGVHDLDEGTPALFPGGIHVLTSPYLLKELIYLGLNMVNIANNHAMDFGEGGLLATIRNLKEQNIPFCGAGENLAEASQPCYFEAPNCRIGMLGITSSFHDSYAAGPQSSDMKGRPGVSPLKHRAVYQLPEEDYKALLRISQNMGVNSYHDQARKEGFLPDDGFARFGSFVLERSDAYCCTTSPNEKDLDRTLSNIRQAKNQSDFVIVQVHGHQFKGSKSVSPQFIETFARKCIDEGASIVAITGPHEVRGVERYKDGIILYSLGNFILQEGQTEHLPEEFYWQYNTSRNDCYGSADVLNIRSQNGTKGLDTMPQVWESVIVKFEWSEQTKKVQLIPIKLHNSSNKALKGLPYLTKDTHIIEVIKKLSEPYNTEITIDSNGHGVIDLSI